MLLRAQRRQRAQWRGEVRIGRLLGADHLNVTGRVATLCARALCAVCALCLLCALDVVLYAQPATERGRAEALAHRAAERIRVLQAEADALAAQSRTILVDLRRLEVERQIKAADLTRLDAEAVAAGAELAATIEEAATLERQVVDETPAINARLVALYKMGRPGYWRLLLNVDDVTGVGRAYRTVAAMARMDRERISEHQRKLTALGEARTNLERRAAETRRLRAEAAAARMALDRAIAGRNARVRAIDHQRDLNAQLTGELQDAQRRLQSALGDLAAGRATEHALDGAILLPLTPFRGDLPWPARGRVVAPFGRERDPKYGTSIVRNGIEMAADEGQSVLAVHDGRVAFAGPFTGFGTLVIIEHAGNSYSLYGHLETAVVKKGDTVERQRQIGTVGTTPTGRAALYFELRVDGRPVDPLQWLQR
jgi:murein hydrolase activator